MSGEVQVVGLTAARKALRALGDPKAVDAEFRKEGRAISDQVVRRTTVEAALTGRPEIQRAARTVKAASTINGAAVRIGAKTGDSWAAAALFGTHADQPRQRRSGTFLGYNQFVRPQRDGGPLWRAIAKEREQISERYMDALERIFVSTQTD
jgi:hypothetical protein